MYVCQADSHLQICQRCASLAKLAGTAALMLQSARSARLANTKVPLALLSVIHVPTGGSAMTVTQITTSHLQRTARLVQQARLRTDLASPTAMHALRDNSKTRLAIRLAAIVHPESLVSPAHPPAHGAAAANT
jgi:hypothetical protein